MAGTATESGHPTMADLLTTNLLEERGRKRRRTSDDVTAHPVAHNPSGESTTLRGRGRRRSASGASSQSDGMSKPRTRTLSTPMRKYQKKTVLLEPAQKKRSQSPSRSRSRGRDRTPRRRRQRTKSRSRSHGVEQAAKQGSNHEETGQKKKSGSETTK
jgi:hypothetical protein